MQADAFACYVGALIADPAALLVSLAILGGGFLLFGLEPTPDDEAYDQ